MSPDARRRLAIAGACLVAASLGFLGGRSSAPARVEWRERERVVYQDRAVEQVAEQRQEQAERHDRRVVRRTQVKRPDGTEITREVERQESGERQQIAEARVEVREVERIVYRDREAERVEVSRPDWRVGILAGVPARLPPGPALVGGYVERRVLGPVSAGAWALVPTGPGHAPAAGVLLSVEF